MYILKSPMFWSPYYMLANVYYLFWEEILLVIVILANKYGFFSYIFLLASAGKQQIEILAGEKSELQKQVHFLCPLLPFLHVNTFSCSFYLLLVGFSSR